MKKCTRILSLLLALSMLAMYAQPVEAVSSKDITSESIRNMQNQISNAEKERKQLKNGLSNVKNLVAKLEKEKTSLKNYVEQLDHEVEEIEGKILDLNDDILQKEEEIAITTLQLEHAQQVEADQYAAMTTRIQMNYEQGRSVVASLLIGVASFGEFLNRSVYVNAVVEYDDQMLDSIIRTREYVELCKQTLEEEKLTLDLTKEGLETEELALEALIEEKAAEIKNYENSIKNNEAAIKEYEADIAAQNQLIKDLEAAVAAEKKRILESNRKVITYDGGTFKFPLETYTRISDPYGDRIHPILNVAQFHNGVDFAAPKGTKIYAAYDGVVVAAAYSNTMGNYIMIDHGNELYTIYMHASKLSVSKDEVVVKGQKIGEVGSTGRSTGNHLHFSVRKDGAYTSPWNYLSE